MKSSQNIQRLGHTKFISCSSDFVLKTLERASDLKMLISFPFFVCVIFDERNVKILCRKYSSYIFHVFSEARDHILILNISFFNKLRQIIPEIRSERRDLLIFIFILKTTGTFTPVHSVGYLILRNEFRSTGSGQAEYTSVILHPGDGTLTEYLNTCVTIFGNNQKCNTHFVTR